LREFGMVVSSHARREASNEIVRDFVAAWDKVMNLDRFDHADHRITEQRATAAPERRGCYGPGSSCPQSSSRTAALEHPGAAR
jgi:hypothetical protein